METSSWQQIEDIFHIALEKDSSDRNQYLRSACAGNSELLKDVCSLLNADQAEPDFLSESTFELGLKVIDGSDKHSLTGQIIGNYDIKEKLGEGGMGAVYLAHDLTLNRPVALKFLAESFLNDIWARRQLLREAQAVAMLDHPNICNVY